MITRRCKVCVETKPISSSFIGTLRTCRECVNTSKIKTKPLGFVDDLPVFRGRDPYAAPEEELTEPAQRIPRPRIRSGMRDLMISAKVSRRAP